ncbi:TetR/AcrR family transcriptional regulator [Amycolatopsis sp. NPDC058986]|uniref:TetR/AcrR family transcriptional regulator n=1 Tax=unclassified Amycolatopsis TaxID=2618356 RepID=UPI00366F39D1
MANAATSPRERYRAQMRTEIKEQAWEQIATSGASALSLNAIAKQLGMSGPALYRYYASRHDLITELIRDAYRSLADTLAEVAAAGDADLPRLGRTVRAWALEDPQRYFLIYGTPVPGYHAPADTTTIADEIMAVLLAASPDAETAPEMATRRAMAFWTRVHGVLSLELAGQFAGLDLDPAALFESELDSLREL